MKSMLSYDSPLMTMMRGVGNTMLINIMFLLCCIPVVTIGAAWTALFAAGRVLIEDGPCIRTYCKSFLTSLKRATLAWLILLPCLLLSVVAAVLVWRLRMAGMPLGQMSLVISVIAVVLQYMATYDVFISCDPNNAVLYLVLSIFVNVTMPFFIFACRNKDLGMPRRRPAQPAAPVVPKPADEEAPVQTEEAPDAVEEAPVQTEEAQETEKFEEA